MKLERVVSSAACALAALALSACGGGGDEESSAPGTGPTTQTPPPPASGATATTEGAYQGLLSGGLSSALQLLILENGEYWAIYGNEVAGTLEVSGFIQGSGLSGNGSVTSPDARDFGDAPPAQGTVHLTVGTDASIRGSATFGGQSFAFSGTALPRATYDYGSPARISAIAGAWRLLSLQGTVVSLVIADGGSFSSSTEGCSFTGAFSPRASGKNVYDVSVTFGPAPCELSDRTVRGIGTSSRLEGSDHQQLTVGLVDASRTVGMMFFGAR
jgi:hypothetical protein